MEFKEDRVRAWLVFNVDNRISAAANIAPFLKAGGPDWVVVRGDLVNPDSGYDLVVPVDARDLSTLESVKQNLLSSLPARSVLVLRVEEEHSLPWPPHAASCYVTGTELKGSKYNKKGLDLPEFNPPGRHPRSPGANPWG